MDLPVLVINRSADQDRLDAFTSTCDMLGVSAERLAAYDGHRADAPFSLYADLIGTSFWGEASAKPGALACFLSHRKAWQTVVDGSAPIVLVCEDDTKLTEDTARLQRIASDLTPFDVIFANDRLASWCDAVAGTDAACRISAVMDAQADAGGPAATGVRPAPGGDCYLISQRGARRLLDLTARQRIVCGVDWAMVWSAMGAPSSNIAVAFPEIASLQQLLEPVSPPLDAWVLRDPISAVSPGPSTLRHSVTSPIATLTQRTPMLAHAEYISLVGLGQTTLCFAGRSGPDPVMAAHRDGTLWDEPGLRLLLDRFPEGGTFVDIGAHIGNHSVVMARLGAAGHLIACEANDEVMRLLQTNFAINGLQNSVTLAQPGQAIGSTRGKAWILRNRRRSSETMVKADRPPEAGDEVSEVEIIQGDDLVADRPVDAIKIDTSGSEVDVLRSFARTLVHSRPIVLLDHAETARDRIVKLAGDFGLKVTETVPSGRKRRSSSLLIPG